MTLDPEPSDEALLAQLQRGDLEALEALYERYHRVLLALAYRVAADQQVAEEVFLAVWRRASTYEPAQGKVRPWLFTIVRHRAIDRSRGR